MHWIGCETYKTISPVFTSIFALWAPNLTCSTYSSKNMIIIPLFPFSHLSFSTTNLTNDTKPKKRRFDQSLHGNIAFFAHGFACGHSTAQSVDEMNGSVTNEHLACINIVLFSQRDSRRRRIDGRPLQFFKQIASFQAFSQFFLGWTWRSQYVLFDEVANAKINISLVEHLPKITTWTNTF